MRGVSGTVVSLLRSMHARSVGSLFSTCMVDWCARGGLLAGESTDGDTGDTSVHTVVAERRTTNQPCGAS